MSSFIAIKSYKKGVHKYIKSKQALSLFLARIECLRLLDSSLSLAEREAILRLEINKILAILQCALLLKTIYFLGKQK